MKKINVLHVINELEPGGAEILLVDIAKYIGKDRFNMSVAYLYGEGTLRPALEELGIPVYYLNCRSRQFLTALRRLIRLVHREKIDILHSHLLFACVLGRIAAKLTRIKVNLSTRHYGFDVLNRRLRYRLDRLTSRMSDIVIAVSNNTADYIREKERLHNKNLVVISNGVNTEMFHYVTRDQNRGKIIGTISSLRIQKRPDLFVKICSEISKTYPEVAFEIIGSGPEEELVLDLAGELGISRRLRMHGCVPRNQIMQKTEKWSIFILTSDWESFGIAVTEAMAMGLPVVTFGVGGLREVIRDGVDGFLVDSGDIDAFVERIGFLIDNPDKAKVMGENGRKRAVEKYSVRKMVNEYEELYIRLLKSKGYILG